jgi:carnitine 3-dehydrogenase
VLKRDPGDAGAERIERVAIVGTGVIGTGWAARCLANGLEVVATDPAPRAEERIRAGVASA